MKQMYIYIMSNQINGTIYIGVTNNLVRRVWEHKNHILKGFTSKYNLTKLVYYEVWQGEREAIQREKNLKRYPRAWKLNLINDFNPEWRDLYDSIL